MLSNLPYKETNKALWNQRTDYHIHSEFYNVAAFKTGRNSLSEIELKLLGDVKGKKILHLQCHFGMDSLSLSRLGADVTAVDFSEKAIAEAEILRDELGLNARFICCDIYELSNYLDEKFDIVFTSFGTIGWLPDLDKWAATIVRYMKADARFIFAEFHPFVWMYDNDFTSLTYSYFKTEPIVEKEEGTYADEGANIHLNSITWNHSIGEVISALVKHHLAIIHFDEYHFSPWPCFKGIKAIEEKRFIIEKFGQNVPLVYSLTAVNMPASFTQ